MTVEYFYRELDAEGVRSQLVDDPIEAGAHDDRHAIFAPVFVSAISPIFVVI